MSEKDGGAVLYERYIKGDGDALRELVESYAASLVLFINRYVNNLSVAEELMEDSFCDIVMKHGRFKGESSFKTYLFAIARNKAVDHVRRRARMDVVALEDVERELVSGSSPTDAVIREETQRELWVAMDKLNADYREVLYLIYFEGLSPDEAGRVLRRSRSQMKNLVYRAKASLREKLEEGGFVYEGL